MSITGGDAVEQLDDALDQPAHLAAVDAQVGRVPVDGDFEQEDGGEGHHGVCEDRDPDDGVPDVGLFEDHVEAGHGGGDGDVGGFSAVHGEDGGVRWGKRAQGEGVELEFGEVVVQNYTFGGVGADVGAVA